MGSGVGWFIHAFRGAEDFFYTTDEAAWVSRPATGRALVSIGGGSKCVGSCAGPQAVVLHFVEGSSGRIGRAGAAQPVAQSSAQPAALRPDRLDPLRFPESFHVSARPLSVRLSVLANQQRCCEFVGKQARNYFSLQ